MSKLPDPNSLFPGPTVTPGLPDMKSLFEGINFTPELPRANFSWPVAD